MADTLYTAAILRLKLAGEAPQRLAAPQGSASRVSPVCGSKMVADVTLDGQGRVAAFGFDASRACTLGQASAAVLAAAAAGADRAQLAGMRASLADFLAQRRDDAPEGWQMFAPARPHRARHPSILLPLDAVLAAVDAAGTAA
ncbi:iron-sulfur cluster assembly scaffold protein [Sandarakinorhabdus sp.]|uniref:iron-sulfur cluster assembly scaffold protein n=1 Tax=Sandarakinorhabdus sp. TaxID=1916663 RepID=UPI003341893A